MKIQNPKNRQGITLLFVISMIVLFLLMGTTFVVISNDYFKAARKRGQAKIHTVDHEAMIRRAFYDVVRGPSLLNQSSPLRAHDLMSDQYGYGFKAFVDTVIDQDDGGESLKITLRSGYQDPDDDFGDDSERNRVQDLRKPDDPGLDYLDQEYDDPNAPNGKSYLPVARLFDGLVFSFVSGPATGYSTRIAIHSYNDVTGNHEFLIPFPRVGQFEGSNVAANGLVGSEIIVNGRDFSGTGAGGPKPAGPVELGDSALQPNRVGQLSIDFMSDYLDGGNHSPNESYDAADFQNMFLSGRDRDGEVIPSFHRASLSDFGGGGAGPNEFRPVSSSPPVDEDTANGEFIYGGSSLDVDSDNDGELDAVFIDNGYEVITGVDGRRFKPLVAYKVVDLDGRLNLNAHGSLVQAEDTFFVSDRTHLSDFPRGQGYGPPEISFRGLVDFDRPKYQYLLEGRYGQSGTPGFYNDAEPDTLRKMFGYPRGVVNWPGAVGTVNRDAADNGSLFASSAMDIHGRFSFGFPELAVVANGNPIDDFRDPNMANFRNGLPVIDMIASEFGNDFEYSNNPYEMTFDSQSGSSHSNSPYSPADLERHLRPFDVDTNVLSKRIPFDSETDSETGVDNGILGGIPRSRRNLITTESWDVPMIPDNFKAKLISRLPALAADLGLGSTLPEVNVRADMLIQNNMFAPELLAGLKMNVNRPLGNGWDDNNNGIVDEPAEANLERNKDFTKFKNPEFDLNDDLVPNGGGALGSEANARVIFARHLYMLAMLLSDEVDVDLDGDTNTSEYAQVIAQWAVNVVDFRDPDSIMTRFQFDPNPWVDSDNDGNPWEVNNVNVVWGVERPELLITETLAAHSRRTEDLTVGNANGNQNGNQNGNGNGNPQDNEFDQGLRPEPFAFIELYNPWTQNSLNQKLDPSLHDNSNQAVQLDRLSDAANGNRSPVWRLSIDRPERDNDPSAIDPDAGARRFVYFTNPDVDADTIGDDNAANVEVYYSERDNDWNAYQLRPGSQAIVGTLGFEDGGAYRTFMGRLQNQQDATLTLDNTQHIQINPETGEVERFPADPNVAVRQTTIVPVNKARRGTANSTVVDRTFSVSDPFEGYPEVDQNNVQMVPVDDGFRYNSPYNLPFDRSNTSDNNRNSEDLDRIMIDDGMSVNFREIRLQRLADPTRPWDQLTNPYFTIDEMQMDLIAFNGVETQTETGLNNADKQDGSSSLERGVKTNNALSKYRDLWRSARGGVNNIPNGVVLGGHAFGRQLNETIGKTNEAYTDANAVADGNPFTWLTWNNRPYVSHLELANVPFAKVDWLTKNFSTKQDSYDPYSGDDNMIRGRFHHLLNFFANDTDAGADRANLHRIMDYLEVPSRFAGTRDYLNTDNYPQPFNFLSRYRVPGKINLNTIYPANPAAPNQSLIWNGLQRRFWNLGGGLNYQNFADSRENGNPGPAMPTDFGNPYRPSDENVNVPQGVPLVSEVGSTLFRNKSIGNTTDMDPLFDFDNSAPIYNADRNAYFRNAQRQRLGNLVTTKSSVFAVWVTVGYFEVDGDGLIGAEIGSDTGDVKRNRGFFMFDRSIPMAFEPGKNHNIEKGVLVETIIE